MHRTTQKLLLQTFCTSVQKELLEISSTHGIWWRCGWRYQIVGSLGSSRAHLSTLEHRKECYLFMSRQTVHDRKIAPFCTILTVDKLQLVWSARGFRGRAHLCPEEKEAGATMTSSKKQGSTDSLLEFRRACSWESSAKVSSRLQPSISGWAVCKLLLRSNDICWSTSTSTA